MPIDRVFPVHYNRINNTYYSVDPVNISKGDQGIIQPEPFRPSGTSENYRDGLTPNHIYLTERGGIGVLPEQQRQANSHPTSRAGTPTNSYGRQRTPGSSSPSPRSARKSPSVRSTPRDPGLLQHTAFRPSGTTALYGDSTTKSRGNSPTNQFDNSYIHTGTIPQDTFRRQYSGSSSRTPRSSTTPRGGAKGRAKTPPTTQTRFSPFGGAQDPTIPRMQAADLTRKSGTCYYLSSIQKKKLAQMQKELEQKRLHPPTPPEPEEEAPQDMDDAPLDASYQQAGYQQPTGVPPLGLHQSLASALDPDQLRQLEAGIPLHPHFLTAAQKAQQQRAHSAAAAGY